jgi:uncharacterized protein (DUF1697 family)
VTTWVGLLRAVNVGGNNKVPMAELRAVLDDLGLGPVQTYIQSGNVVFRAPKPGRDALAARMEQAIESVFSVATPVILRTAAEVQAVIDAHPFGDDTSTTYVSFLATKPSAAAVRALEAEAGGSGEEALVRGSDLYLRYPQGVQDAKLTGPRLARLTGVPGTVRNWRTVTRLAELAGG